MGGIGQFEFYEQQFPGIVDKKRMEKGSELQ
jgi:hypothetical protein